MYSKMKNKKFIIKLLVILSITHLCMVSKNVYAMEGAQDKEKVNISSISMDENLKSVKQENKRKETRQKKKKSKNTILNTLNTLNIDEMQEDPENNTIINIDEMQEDHKNNTIINNIINTTPATNRMRSKIEKVIDKIDNEELIDLESIKTALKGIINEERTQTLKLAAEQTQEKNVLRNREFQKLAADTNSESITKRTSLNTNNEFKAEIMEAHNKIRKKANQNNEDQKAPAKNTNLADPSLTTKPKYQNEKNVSKKMTANIKKQTTKITDEHDEFMVRVVRALQMIRNERKPIDKNQKALEKNTNLDVPNPTIKKEYQNEENVFKKMTAKINKPIKTNDAKDIQTSKEGTSLYEAIKQKFKKAGNEEVERDIADTQKRYEEFMNARKKENNEINENK